MADKDKDEMLDENEFKAYLVNIGINDMPSIFKNAIKPKPANPVASKGPTPELKQSVETFKKQTNYTKLYGDELSVEKLSQLVETPFPKFELIPSKHFYKIDKTGKFTMTILKSRKAAILRYSIYLW